MRSFIFFACLFAVFSGCDNNDPDDAGSEAIGQYNMTMMDGAAVPDIFTDGAGNELVLAGGELVIRDDGRYFLEIAVVVNGADESVNTSGDYALTGQTLMLEDGITGVYDGEDEVALTYPVAGLSHLFTFDISSVFDDL